MTQLSNIDHLPVCRLPIHWLEWSGYGRQEKANLSRWPISSELLFLGRLNETCQYIGDKSGHLVLGRAIFREEEGSMSASRFRFPFGFRAEGISCRPKSITSAAAATVL